MRAEDKRNAETKVRMVRIAASLVSAASSAPEKLGVAAAIFFRETSDAS